MASGIYKIECNVTGKVYVGSAVNLYRRWHASHLPLLRQNRHCNAYLQRAWNKYGEKSFVFVVLEYVPKARLIKREQHWLDQLQSASCAYGFNLCAVAGSPLGVKHSDETKAKVSAANSRSYIVRNPRGRERTIKNLTQFCKRNGLTRTAMGRVANGFARHHRNWECRHVGKSREEWLAELTAPARKAVTRRGSCKRCSKCKRYRKLIKFSCDFSTQSGLAAYCNDCQRTRAAGYRSTNQDKLSAVAALYRERNREQLRLQAKEYYANNREKCIAAAVEYKRKKRRAAKC